MILKTKNGLWISMVLFLMASGCSQISELSKKKLGSDENHIDSSESDVAAMVIITSE